jgi:hypothetical protein
VSDVDRFAFERAVLADPAIVRLRLAVLMTLASHWDRRTNRARVSIATLSTETGHDESRVREALRWARSGGYLDQVVRGHRLGNGQVKCSEYRLAVPQQGAVAPIEAAPRQGAYAPPESGLNRALPQPQPGATSASTGASGTTLQSLASETSSSERGTQSVCREKERLEIEEKCVYDPADVLAGLRVRGIRSPGAFLRSDRASHEELRRIARAGYFDRRPHLDIDMGSPYDEPHPDEIPVSGRNRRVTA